MKPLTVLEHGGGEAVRLGPLGGQPPLGSGQDLPILIQDGVPGVGALLHLGVTVILKGNTISKFRFKNTYFTHGHVHLGILVCLGLPHM